MRHIAYLVALLTTTAALAAPGPKPITANSRGGTLPAQTVDRAEGTTFRVTYKDGADASDITGQTPWMAWYTNATAGGVSTAACSIVVATNGTADCTFSATALNYTAGRYLYAVGVVSGSVTTVYGQGVFGIRGSPYTVGVDPVNWSTNWTWGTFATPGWPDWQTATEVGTATAAVYVAANEYTDIATAAVVAASGDITGVTAGTWATGGGDSGAVTVNVDQAAVLVVIAATSAVDQAYADTATGALHTTVSSEIDSDITTATGAMHSVVSAEIGATSALDQAYADTATGALHVTVSAEIDAATGVVWTAAQTPGALLTNGARSMAGDLDMDGNDIDGGGGTSALTNFTYLYVGTIRVSPGPFYLAAGTLDTEGGTIIDATDSFVDINDGLRVDGLLAMVGNGVTGVAARTESHAAATYGQVTAATGGCVQVAGDTMSGGLSMGNNGVSNFAWLVAYNNTLNAAALSAGILSGQENEILTDSTYAFVGGGYNNKITGSSGASIMGGYDNDIGDNAHYSGTLGGYSCDVQAGAEYATVLGGAYNDAQKKFTTVAGRRAHASHAGSFVWADSANSDYASRATNSFNIRAAGGIYYNTTCVASNGAVLIGALSIAPVTNNQAAVTLAGTFSGNGAGLTNLSVSGGAIQTTPYALTSAATVTVSEAWSTNRCYLNMTNNVQLAVSGVNTNKAAGWILDVKMNSYSLSFGASITNLTNSDNFTRTNSYQSIIGNRPIYQSVTEVW